MWIVLRRFENSRNGDLRLLKGGAKGGDGGAGDARRAEAERQDAIRKGTTQINSIFEGAGQGTTLATSIDPSGTYYDAEGRVFDPSGRVDKLRNNLFGGAGGSDEDLRRQALEQAMAEGQLYSDRQVNGGFDDAFFNKRRQSYIDYATPQLEDQYAEAVKQLTFALARNGTLDSSVRADQQGKLQKQYDTQRQGITDQAIGYENDARNAVEQARSDLIKTLNATGDASAASQSAINQAKLLSQPQAYSPLGQLFLDSTSGIANQADLERRGQARYDTGLFTRRPGSSSTVVG